MFVYSLIPKFGLAHVVGHALSDFVGEDIFGPLVCIEITCMVLQLIKKVLLKDVFTSSHWFSDPSSMNFVMYIETDKYINVLFFL